MQEYLKCVACLIVLITAAILLLPAISAQENSTALNSMTPENVTVNNTTQNNTNTNGNAAPANTTSGDIAQNSLKNEAGNGSVATSATSPQEGSSSNEALQMGKGLNENVIDTSSLNKGGGSFSVDQGGIGSPFQIGQAQKPVRDLEKVVFICNIV
jgi:hypothetical protein